MAPQVVANVLNLEQHGKLLQLYIEPLLAEDSERSRAPSPGGRRERSLRAPLGGIGDLAATAPEGAS
ncbi:MAG: hypothetical protein M3075_11590 [Candidatus Dormibacteraeota bacterium]|nr:hypothetical protein [Candidatus Dormibacteraeota bacterium]